MTDATVSSASPRLLDQVRGKIRLKHYSIRTEQAYMDWIKRYILFHGKRYPNELGAQRSIVVLRSNIAEIKPIMRPAWDRPMDASAQRAALGTQCY